MKVHADISQFRILAHVDFLVVTMLFFLLTYMKHIDDHDAVIRAVNTSDFPSWLFDRHFQISWQDSRLNNGVCVSFILFQTILFLTYSFHSQENTIFDWLKEILKYFFNNDLKYAEEYLCELCRYLICFSECKIIVAHSIFLEC